MGKIPILIELNDIEKKIFDDFIKKERAFHIRSSQIIVDEIFELDELLMDKIKSTLRVSHLIKEIREQVWIKFLEEEVEFNAAIMRNLHNLLDTPKEILNVLMEENIVNKEGEELRNSIMELCGEYAGRVFPYLYKLSLSNTQSRRSRAGRTFEAIMYKLYEILEYQYDSQSKVGRKIFDEAGLGKKVDSILPGIKEFNKRRNKTIIGTMKTTLRERWQEVAEEIERTKIPEIHLLTVDENISESKASEMSKHNIVVVAYFWIANSEKLKDKKNIISFEEYFFEEIPSVLKFWNED